MSAEIIAPFAGQVTVTVEPGMPVRAGDPVAIIEALKLEAPLKATVSGVIGRVAITGTQLVDGGDLVLVVTPSAP